MKEIVYKIAGVVFSAKINFEYTQQMCSKYEYNGSEPIKLYVEITREDILKEHVGAPEFPAYYLENLALFRKLCDYLLNNEDGIVFHSSAIMVDGQAYLFTAPSGTGKSTHTSLWRDLLKDKAVMVNDDKPIVKMEDGEFYVYGTPWNGKHGLDTNCKAKVKAICHIYQAKENSIKEVSASEMLMVILNQTIRPTELAQMDKLLNILDAMLKKVKIYSLGCNISKEAAELSYKTMSGKSYED